jgi:predicted histidine transporter YuiF (NhaC family)
VKAVEAASLTLTMSIESLAAFRRTGRSIDLAQLAEKHLEHDLQDSDREILQQSVAKVGTHATLGSIVGLGLGILFAYRLRRGRANAFKALRAAEKPTHVQFADGKIGELKARSCSYSSLNLLLQFQSLI